MVLLTRLRDLTLKDCTYYDFDELVKETVLDHVAMSHHIRTAFEIENVWNEGWWYKTVNILLKEKRMGCEDSVREWENYLFWSYKDLTGVLEY